MFQGNGTEETVFEKRMFFKEDFKELTDRNSELVPDSWRLVRERALSTVLHAERLYSEHSSVSRRAELPRSVRQPKMC